MAGSDSSSIENGGGIVIPAGQYYSHDTPYLTPVGSEKGRFVSQRWCIKFQILLTNSSCMTRVKFILSVEYQSMYTPNVVIVFVR